MSDPINFTPLDFHYDSQIQRYFLQFMRIFSGFQYMTGKDSNGVQTLKRVPCRYADVSRQVSYILKNQSENFLLTTPFITCQISGLTMAPDRRQDPKFISRIQTAEREWDTSRNEYTQDLGVKATVQRFMPVPYEMTTQVNIWCSNIVQKLQLFEQISILFNPSLDIQSSVNALDWSAFTFVEMQDITWTSKTIPAGTDDALDVMTITFKIPIWINPPAKVKKQNLIEQIILNIGESDNMTQLEENYSMEFSDTQLYTRVIVSQDDAILTVSNNELTMDGDKTWLEYFRPYKTNLRNGLSTISIKPFGDLYSSDDDIVGTIQIHPTDPYKLLWTVDPSTLPANSIPAINAVIDPLNVSPNNGLPPAIIGQRYLITDEIGICENWKLSVAANANDIIEYDGEHWNIAFNNNIVNTRTYVLNNLSGKQLCWTGEYWMNWPDGEYGPGYWRIEL